MSRDLAIVALCPTYRGVTAMTTQPEDDGAHLRAWIARGDILHAKTVEWVRLARVCVCSLTERAGDRE